MDALNAAAKLVLSAADKVIGFETVEAHCDIPCGIYDPHQAQVAAHTVLRMDMLIAETAQVPPTDTSTRNKMIRYVTVKEQHAELVKHEIRIIWGDYIKPEMATPEVHKLVWDIMKAASKAKQDADVNTAKDLLSKVQQFAEWFWKTKDVKTKRVKSAYPTNEEIIMPQM